METLLETTEGLRSEIKELRHELRTQVDQAAERTKTLRKQLESQFEELEELKLKLQRSTERERQLLVEVDQLERLKHEIAGLKNSSDEAVTNAKISDRNYQEAKKELEKALHQLTKQD